jgi:hypothetical protein
MRNDYVNERRSISPTDMITSPITDQEFLSVEYDFPDDPYARQCDEFDPIDYVPPWPTDGIMFSIDLNQGAIRETPLGAGSRMTGKSEAY